MKIRRILITGGAGYIGQHLVKRLSEWESNQITIVDPVESKIKNVIQWRGTIKEHKNNIVSGDFTDIFHLASLSSVRCDNYHPMDHLIQNVGSTIDLLDALQEGKGKPNVYFSSSCTVYGNNNQRGVVTENTDVDPISTYGTSKLFCEELLESAVGPIINKAINLRFFNVIGCDPEIGEPNGLEKGRLVPKLIRAAVKKEKFTFYGEPDSMSRDYIDVKFLAKVMSIVMFNVKYANSTYVIGSGDSHTTGQMLTLTANAIGKPIGACICPPIEQEAEHVRSFPNLLKEHMNQWGYPFITIPTIQSVKDMYMYYQNRGFLDFEERQMD